jgi:hypothetical protein
MHSAGVHSVGLPWLERLQISHLTSTSLDSLNLDELQPTEFTHLISTQPFPTKPSQSFQVGLACLHGFGNTSCLLISVNNQAELVCVNVKRSCGLDTARAQLMDESRETGDEADEFTELVSSILRRKSDLPILKAGDVQDLGEEEMSEFVKQVVGIVRGEYVKRQGEAMMEFQKRSALLEQQKKLQVEIVREIREKMRGVGERMERCREVSERCGQKQAQIRDG